MGFKSVRGAIRSAGLGVPRSFRGVMRSIGAPLPTVHSVLKGANHPADAPGAYQQPPPSWPAPGYQTQPSAPSSKHAGLAVICLGLIMSMCVVCMGASASPPTTTEAAYVTPPAQAPQPLPANAPVMVPFDGSRFGAVKEPRADRPTPEAPRSYGASSAGGYSRRGYSRRSYERSNGGSRTDRVSGYTRRDGTHVRSYRRRPRRR